MRASAGSVLESHSSVHVPLAFSVAVVYGALGALPAWNAQSASPERSGELSGQRPSGTRVGDAEVVHVAVLARVDRERPAGQLPVGDRALVGALEDADVLGGAHEGVVVGHGRDGVVVAADGRVGRERLLVLGAVAAVVVEVRPLVEACRGRRRAGPGRRVLAHGDRGDVADVARGARGEGGEAGPADAGVDAGREGPAPSGSSETVATSLGTSQFAGAARLPSSPPEPGHSCALPGLVGASVVWSAWPQPRNSSPAGR